MESDCCRNGVMGQWGNGMVSTAMLSQWGRIKDIPQSLRDLTAARVNLQGLAERSGKWRRQCSKLAHFGSRVVAAHGVGELFDSALAHFWNEELCELAGRTLCVAPAC
jgi:hypothetical protein